MRAANRWGNGSHLTKALFNQDRIWVTAAAEVKQITDMTPQHTLNTLLMLERMSDLPYDTDQLHSTPLYRALKARVESEFKPEPGAWDKYVTDLRRMDVFPDRPRPFGSYHYSHHAGI